MLRILLLAAVSTLVLSLVPVSAAEEDVNWGWQDSGMTAGGGQHGYTTQKTVDQQLTSLITGNQQPMGIGGQSTVTGMPFAGTFLAPANMALQGMNHSAYGGTLPITNLDSIVAQSGYADDVFGDEGTDSYPQDTSFGTISAGMDPTKLTTGHDCVKANPDFPSAWY